MAASAANTMNFGPEWMRRAKPTNGNVVPTAPTAGPSRDHPAFKSATLASKPVSSTTATSPSNSTQVPVSNQSSGENASSTFSSEPVKFAPPLDPLDPAPFRYTHDFMLSLFKTDLALPTIDFESYEVVLSEETLPPVSTLPLTETEETHLASGSVNNEANRRPSQQQGNSRGGRGGRGNNRGGRGGYGSGGRNNSGAFDNYEEGFRNFISRAQVAEEPAWAGSNTQPSIGRVDAQGVFRFENVNTRGGGNNGGRGNRGGSGGSGGGGAHRPLYDRRGSDLAAVAAEFTLAQQQAQQMAPSTTENPEETLWFYRDPQGNIQGPFTGLDMHEWYKAGFFTANLLVKREGDRDFEQLGMLVQMLGNDDMPFLLPAPLRRPMPHIAQAPRSALLMPAGQGTNMNSLPSSNENPDARSVPPTPSFVSGGADRFALFDGSPWPEEAYAQEVEREKERIRQQMDRQRLVHVLQQRQAGQVNQAATSAGQRISRGYQSDLLAKLNQQDTTGVDQLTASVAQLDVDGQPPRQH